MKHKGIHRTATVEETLTGEKMREICAAAAHGANDGPVVTLSQFQIRKDVRRQEVWNTNLLKCVAFSSNKRWFKKGESDPHLTSLPYGFCRVYPHTIIDN